eukprot:PhM_4_TR1185/c0_g1_i1/m.69048
MSFDTAKKIEALEAKLEDLEKQLVPGLDKDEKLAIRKNIDTIGNQITVLFGRLPDERSLLQRGWDKMLDDPFVMGTGVVTTYSTGTWLVLRQYSLARHHIVPYTERQLNWRRWVFFFDAKSTPTAVRVFGVSALLTVLRSWTLPPPRGWGTK